MDKYWKKHFNSNAEIFRDSPLKQVDRTLNGEEIDSTQLESTVEAIVGNLSLSKSDSVADICCGNGLITRKVAEYCRTIIGFDFSEKLIENACLNSSGRNIEYIVADAAALDIDGLSSSPEKFFMQDSVQFMDHQILSALLQSISRIQEFKTFLISGIPDSDKLRAYYDTDDKMAYYHHREAEGRPHIGTWWDRGDISDIANRAGFKVSFIAQNPFLCTAHYRYDCLIERQ